MGIKPQGGNNTPNLASVNTRNQLQVVTPKDLTGGLSGGFIQISSEVDAGKTVGRRTVLALECSDDYRLRVGTDQTIFNATFEGTTNFTTQFSSNLSGFGSQQSNGLLTINNLSATSASNYGYLRTYRHFPTFGTYPTYLDLWIQEKQHTALNAISEWGFLYITSGSTQQPIDGVYFRRTQGGQLKGIITNNSLDLEEIDIDTTNVPSRDGVGLYDPNETQHYLISFHNDVVRFWINDVVVGEIACPSQLAIFAASTNLPVGLRVLNVSTTSAARQLSVGYVNVALGDQNTNKPWSHAMVGFGQGAYQVQQGNSSGPTVTRTTGAFGHPASATARIAGTWIGTSNPGINNLGGLWTSPAMSTLTTDGDYPIFAFQGSTGTAAVPGKTLYVTGVRIGDTSVTTAPGLTGVFISYIVMADGSAIATSTTDAATSTSGKSICIGGQGFSPSEAVGTMKPGFSMDFNSPLVIPAGKYLTVVARPFGTLAGNTLIVTGSVAFNGYFE